MEKKIFFYLLNLKLFIVLGTLCVIDVKSRQMTSKAVKKRQMTLVNFRQTSFFVVN